MRWRTRLGVLGLTLMSGCSSPVGPTAPTGPAASSASTGQSAAPSHAAALTLTIVATYQPLCGGPEPSLPQTTCPPEPVATIQVTVRRLVDGAPGPVVARVRTNALGLGTAQVPPGDYVVEAGKADPPRLAPRPTRVTVAAGAAATVTLRYESSFQ